MELFADCTQKCTSSFRFHFFDFFEEKNWKFYRNHDFSPYQMVSVTFHTHVLKCAHFFTRFCGLCLFSFNFFVFFVILHNDMRHFCPLGHLFLFLCTQYTYIYSKEHFCVKRKNSFEGCRCEKERHGYHCPRVCGATGGCCAG